MRLTLGVTIAIATLCAIHLHASAQSIQPVQAGLQPLYTRITAIDTEMQTLKKTRAGLDVQEQERLTAEEKIQKLQAEKEGLENYIQKVMKSSRSPMVTY